MKPEKAYIYCPFCGLQNVWKIKMAEDFIEYICPECCCVFQLTYGKREINEEDIKIVESLKEAIRPDEDGGC